MMSPTFNKFASAAFLGLFLAACSTTSNPTDALSTQALPGDAKVCFYEHRDYQGRSFCADETNAWVGNSRNDLISSVKVADGTEVTLFQHRDFGGRSLTLDEDTKLVPRNFNDLASSFKVSKTDTGGGGASDDAELAKKCRPKIELNVEDRSSTAARDLEDIYPSAIVGILAPKVCLTLYDTAEEARTPETIVLHIVNKPGGPPAWANPSLLVADYYINTEHTKNYSGEALVEEFEGITAHELTHTYQNFDSGASTGLTEGIADYVRFTLGFTPPGAQPDKNGNWDDGYRTTAFFLLWVEQATPNFVHDVNQAIAEGNFNADTVFKKLTGKTPNQLWAEYRKS